MQLYALDKHFQTVPAWQASRQKEYYCFECSKKVRVRAGFHKRAHFYHAHHNPSCRQNQKSLAHLELQHYVLGRLPLDEARLEQAFQEIDRIGDVAWLSQKIVFEIQCSPISAAEVLKRNEDYASIGWSVVWILHDRRYNKTRLSAAEMALQNSSHYFAHFDEKGKSVIYDQFKVVKEGVVVASLAPYPINFWQLKEVPEGVFPLFLESRKEWRCFFEGDLLDRLNKKSDMTYFQKAGRLFLEHFSYEPADFWKCIKAKIRLLWIGFLEHICEPV